MVDYQCSACRERLTIGLAIMMGAPPPKDCPKCGTRMEYLG